MKKILLILIYSCFMRFFLKLILGIKFNNREVLKKHPQFIMVANHNSHLDAVTLLAAIPSSIIDKVHPAAASDYFGNSNVKSFFSKNFINALLIPRTRASEDSNQDPIELMVKTLQDGDSLILFPEGTRGEPEVMQRFRRGIGILLQRFPEVPVIPVYLEGLGKSLPKGDAILVPFNSTAYFGNPENPIGETPEEIAEQLEKRTAGLKKELANNSIPLKREFTKAGSEKISNEESAFINAIQFMERLQQINNKNQHC